MMKTYEEAVQYMAVLAQSSSFRYVCQAAMELMSNIYGVPVDTVYDDVNEIIAAGEAARKAVRKQQHREENEARRLANLAKSA